MTPPFVVKVGVRITFLLNRPSSTALCELLNETFALQNEREYILDNTLFLFSGIKLPSSNEDDMDAGGENNDAFSTDIHGNIM